MPLPSRTTKPPLPGGISVTPVPPGGNPPAPEPPVPVGPPVVGGDPDTQPAPPRARPVQGSFLAYGNHDGALNYMLLVPGKGASDGVASPADAAALFAKIAGLLCPTTSPSPRKEVSAESLEPSFEDEVLAGLTEVRGDLKDIKEHLAGALPEEPPVLPKTIWDLLAAAAEGDWPSLLDAPPKPDGVSYDPLKGWRSAVGTDEFADLKVLPALTEADASNVNLLCLRAWLGIGLRGFTGGDWADHLWRRAVVRAIVAGQLPEIAALIPANETDRVLWGILEGEVEIADGFASRIADQIRQLFPVKPDGSGESKSFSQIVADRIRRLSGQTGGTPGLA